MPSDANQLTGREPSLGDGTLPVSGDEPSLSAESTVIELLGLVREIPEWHTLDRRRRMEEIQAKGRAILPALLRLCLNPDNQVATTAITIAEWMADPDAIPTLAEVARTHRNEFVVVDAGKALAKIGAEDALIGLLDDQRRMTRKAAIVALGVMRSEKALVALRRMLNDVEDPDNLNPLIHAVGQIGGRRVLAELEAAAEKPIPAVQNPMVQITLLHQIYHIGGVETIETLLRIAPRALLSTSTLDILARTRDGRVLPILRKCWQTPDRPGQDIDAIRVLRYFHDPMLIGEMKALLRHRDPTVREEAQKVIDRLTREGRLGADRSHVL